MRTNGCLVLAVTCALAAPALSSAQEDRPWASLGIEFGAFSPQTTFQEPSFGETSFDTGAAIGFSATAWPHHAVGLRLKVVRSTTNGTNATSEFAPLAVQDPNQWSFTGEVTARRQLREDQSLRVAPYVALGVGMRHYSWEAARHDESKFFTWTAAGGADLRHTSLGPVGITLELRGYRSQFEGFGVNGGNWRPGTAAREVEGGQDIGFYGGEVDKVWSHDLMFAVGLAYWF